MFTGSAEKLRWLHGEFEKQFECKVETIGYGSDVAKSARFLNRVITYADKGIEMEADQRFVEALVDDLKLIGSNVSPVPGTKPQPIKKIDHQQMIERRLCDQEGGSCVIANLKGEDRGAEQGD